MRLLISFITSAVFAYALSYSAKVEPLHSYAIFAQASGSVTFADEDREGTLLGSRPVIKIDDKMDRFTLNTQEKLYNNQKYIYDIQKKNYDKIKNMKTKSEFEKDAERVTLFNQANALLNILQQIEQLKDSITKKEIRQKGRYLKKLYVKKDSFVNPGVRVMDVEDLSGARVTLFVHKDEIDSLRNRRILVEGKESSYKIDKIYKTTDSSYISAYRVELVAPSPKRFGEIINITFE
jgi:hypothetical protein